MNYLNSNTGSITVTDLTKVYGKENKRICALANVSLEVRSDEFVTLIGPNASGKSTLIKIIAGILPPSAGSVEIEGEIAYMPQDHALLSWRTVEENLMLPSDVRGIPRNMVREKIRDILREFGFLQYSSFYPSALSGGTRQKIALLRTVSYDHSFLLLDEPFAPLDALSRLSAQKWLLALMEKRKSGVLMVSHDIREAIFLSDTIYVLEKGGRVREKISVPLPKPRIHENLNTEGALELEKKLLSLLLPTNV